MAPDPVVALVLAAGALEVAVTNFEVIVVVVVIVLILLAEFDEEVDDDEDSTATALFTHCWLKDDEPTDEDNGEIGGDVVSADGVLGNGGYDANKFL